MGLWLTVAEVVLKAGMFIFNWFGAKEENYKWMVEGLKTVRKKKIARARKIVEDTQKQLSDQDAAWDEYEKRQADNTTPKDG